MISLVTPLPKTGLAGLKYLKGKGSRCLRPGTGPGVSHAAPAGFVGEHRSDAKHRVRPVIPGGGSGKMDDGPDSAPISFKSVRSLPVAPHCRTAGKASAPALDSRRDGTLSFWGGNRFCFRSRNHAERLSAFRKCPAGENSCCLGPKAGSAAAVSDTAMSEPAVKCELPALPETGFDSDMRMPPGLLPTMRSLLLFENAARHQSFSAAAAECCTSQPYVSRIAAGLEREIGFRLFERGHRVIRLTPAGETCHRAVAMGLEDIAAGAYGLEVRRGPQMAVDCGHATPHSS